MSRMVDLNSYLPQVVGDAREIRDMNRVEDLELNGLWYETEKLFYNRWILTADEDGLARYESLLGLKPKGDLLERRRVVWYEWNKNVIYTDRSVRRILDQLLGPDGYFFDIHYEEYTITLSVIVKRDLGDVNYVYDEIRRIIPANIWMKVAVVCMSDLILETTYDSFYYRYWMCGQHLCGTLPWYVNRGVLVDTVLAIQTRQQTQHVRAVLADETKALGEELIYPATNRPELMWLVDSATAFWVPGVPVLYSGGYE